MFTAKFKSDAESQQKFIIQRPRVTPGHNDNTTARFSSHQIAIDSVTLDTNYFYEVVNETDRMKIFSQTPGLTPEQRNSVQLKVTPQVLDELVKLYAYRSPKYKIRY